ncbi:putative glycosyltransferase EpsF [bacterium BMS3Abin05]|nr:putative glycosyltransferase EpsF [bacterium BMS3Abin05]GBE28692.1 putative glycosyltransferase EpsF [bacterium BMS3Bbin03]
MKIGILAHGKSVWMLHWAQLLHEHSHEVCYFSFDPPLKSVSFNYRVIPSPFLKGYGQFILASILFSHLLKKESVEIVHSFYSTNYGLLAALQNKISFVVTCAGSDILVEPHRNKLFHLTNKIVFHRAKALNAVAAHLQKKIVSEYNVDPNKIFVFPEGINLEQFRIQKTRRFPEIVQIVSTRNFHSIYNLEVIFKVIPAIIRQFGKVKFVFLGDGPLKNQFVQQIKSQKLENYVSFLGWQSKDELASVLAQSSVYVSASLSDGASTSLLEAMASGCFPVVSDIPANREWIHHRQNGLLFQPESPHLLQNAIVEVIKNRTLRETSAQENRKLIQSRADEKMILHELENFYDFALR